MKMMFSLFSLSLLAGCWSGPRPMFGGPFGGPGAMIDRVADHIQSKLNLDDGQKKKFQELVSAVKDVLAKHKDEGSHDALAALVTAPTFDQAAFRAELDRQFAQMDQSRSADLDVILPKLAAFLDSLRPEQKKQLDDFRKSGPPWWGGWK